MCCLSKLSTTLSLIGIFTSSKQDFVARPGLEPGTFRQDLLYTFGSWLPTFYHPPNALPIELCRLNSRLSEKSPIYNVYANRETLRIRYGVRTRASAVKGQRVNRFTNRTGKSVKGTFYLRPRISVKLNFTNSMICNSKNCQVATLLNLLLLHIFYHDRTGLEPVTFGFWPTLYPTELTAADIITFRFSLVIRTGLEPVNHQRSSTFVPANAVKPINCLARLPIPPPDFHFYKNIKISRAAPTGFEPVPHAVTGRYCSHSTMEPNYPRWDLPE